MVAAKIVEPPCSRRAVAVRWSIVIRFRSTVSRQGSGWRTLVWLTLTASSLGLVACGSGADTPGLAGPWSSNQQGYGQIKPTTIFNGGDPTGMVKDIHWSSWGGAQALGTGLAVYVSPHQSVAEGSKEIARIVLFQLGRCANRPAYDAIEWYFPQHGQQFNPQQYINACTGNYYPLSSTVG